MTPADVQAARSALQAALWDTHRVATEACATLEIADDIDPDEISRLAHQVHAAAHTAELAARELRRVVEGR